jgi:hypothetical protein
VRELREPKSTNQIFFNIYFYYLIKKGTTVKLHFIFFLIFLIEKPFFGSLFLGIFFI